MRWLSLILLAFLVSASFAEVLVQQDFEGTTFPPAGWSVVNYQPYSYWVRYSDAHTNCAFCSGILSSVTADLNAPNMNLNAGDLLTISFDSKFTNAQATECLIILYWGSDLVWSDSPDRKKQSYNSFTLPAITLTGSYYAQWAFPVGFSNPPFSLFIDNVVISRNMSGNQAQVQPSSLGRIKSAYK
jgi:hypothetical protein